MSDNPPAFSVVIAAYSMERAVQLQELLDNLTLQTINAFEVIVVIEKSRPLFDKLNQNIHENNMRRVRVMFNDRGRDLSSNRNLGISEARGAIIAFVDDDAIPDQCWLDELAANFADPLVGAVGGHIEPLWKRRTPAWYNRELGWIFGCTYFKHTEKPTPVRNVMGCNMAFRAEVFKKAGLFKTNLGRNGKINGCAEEMELCLRIRQANPQVKIIFNPKAIVFHRVPSCRLTIGYIIRRSFDEGVSKKLVRRLNKTKGALSTESSFLKHLLFFAVPSRLFDFHNKGTIQAAALLISIISAGCGYVRGGFGKTCTQRPGRGDAANIGSAMVEPGNRCMNTGVCRPANTAVTLSDVR